MAKQKLNMSLVIVPPPPPRFTLSEWYLNNRVRNRCTLDQQQLAERVLCENQRLIQKIDEQTKLINGETNHYIEDRIKDVEFRKTETEKQRKEVCIEVDNLVMYKERIFDAMKAIDQEALATCKKCIILREARLGIDLVQDDVEIELFKEVDVIEGTQVMLRKTLEQMNEQLRRLRSCFYFIDRDLEDKSNCLALDRHNLELENTSLNLSIYHGNKSLDPANITSEEWDGIAVANFINAATEINNASSLRSYIDIILKQVVEDLLQQYHTVNEAFRRRIEETKEAKTKLEIQHYETVRQINELTRNITNLEKCIAEKEGFMALAHTRLGNRAQRPNAELCRDMAQTRLLDEVSILVGNVALLQHLLAEAQASLRYLLKTQIQLEEDINIKTNTLKIDEVDCMTIRLGMDYHAY